MLKHMTDIKIGANVSELTKRTKMPQIPFSEIAYDRNVYRFIAVDVETANSQNFSICQIGLALVTSSNEIITTSTLIDPACSFDAFNINLHGIDENRVRGAIRFADFMRSTRPLLERHPLIQHSSFDKAAFNGAAKQYATPELRANWHDSVTIARKAWPELRGNGGHGLASLKKHLGLEFAHHDAEQDAYAASMVTLLAEEVTGETFDRLTQPRRENYQRSISVIGSQTGPLYGHVACFTGQLKMSRTEAATVAAGAGIEVKTSVSKKITLLVVGDQDLSLLAGHNKSTKHRRAEELINEGSDIRIIAETEFLQIIETGEVPTAQPVPPLPPTQTPVRQNKPPRVNGTSIKLEIPGNIPAEEPAPKPNPPALPKETVKTGQHIAFKIYYAVIAGLAVLMGYQGGDIGLGLFFFVLLATPVFVLRYAWIYLRTKIL